MRDKIAFNYFKTASYDFVGFIVYTLFVAHSDEKRKKNIFSKI